MQNMIPKISIGMPAYNAESHIGTTIEGLLAQSYADFELIISDNASTDGTRDVVEEYRRRDGRIRYVCHPENIGANPNYSYVVKCARGEYFKWSSSSDWCAPTFLERCLQELQAHDDSVLAATRTRLFESDLSSYSDYQQDIALLEERPTERLMSLTESMALNNAMNGLIRLSALRRTPLIEPYRNADIVLMGYLALMGKFRLVDAGLFYRRMDVKTATALQDETAVWKHHYPKMSIRTLFQGSKRQIGWLRAALSVQMNFGERLRVLRYVAKIWYWERNLFLEDLSDVWKYLLHKRAITSQ